MVDEFRGQHLPHLVLAAGVPHHAGAAAQKDDGTVAGPLHMGHDHQGDEVAYVEAVRSGIEADIESDLFFSQQFSDFIRVGHLFQVAPFFQYIQYVHEHPPTSLDFYHGQGAAAKTTAPLSSFFIPVVCCDLLRSFFRDFRSAVGAPGGCRIHWHLAERAQGGFCFGFFFLEPVHKGDQAEDHKGHDDEIDDIGDEAAIGDHRQIGRFGFCQAADFLAGQVDEQVGKIHPADEDPQRRHDDVIDSRRYDLSESTPDDDTDGHVHYVAPERKVFEFLEKASHIVSPYPFFGGRISSQ